MLILLIGPKGSGKSHVGRLLESALGLHFFQVEPLWMKYYEDCKNEGRDPVISEGVARIHPKIKESRREHQHVCVETVGASKEILDDLLHLDSQSPPLLVRVDAPLSLCLVRIESRDPRQQIPSNLDTIYKSYELSRRIELPFDIVLQNAFLTPDQILEPFKKVLLPGNVRQYDRRFDPGN